MINSELREEKILPDHDDKVWSVSCHPLEDILASSGSDKRIMIWRSSGEQIAILDESHSRTIRAVTWDSSGNYLAAASFDSTITIWKMKRKSKEVNSSISFECIASLEGHENEVKSVAFSISGSFLATCSRDKTIWIWDIEDEGDFSCNNVLQGHTQDVKMVKWSPKEDVLFSCSYDDSIKVWLYEESQEDWTCVNTLKTHVSTVWAIEISKDGEFLFSASDDKSIVLWKINGSNYKDIQLVTKINEAHSRAVLSLSLNWDDSLLATASADNTIAVWSINLESTNLQGIDTNKEGKQISLLTMKQAHEEDVNCVYWGHSEQTRNLLTSCSDDGLIKIWSWAPK